MHAQYQNITGTTSLRHASASPLPFTRKPPSHTPHSTRPPPPPKQVSQSAKSVRRVVCYYRRLKSSVLFNLQYYCLFRGDDLFSSPLLRPLRNKRQRPATRTVAPIAYNYSNICSLKTLNSRLPPSFGRRSLQQYFNVTTTMTVIITRNNTGAIGTSRDDNIIVIK